jgi:hypothetical protein
MGDTCTGDTDTQATHTLGGLAYMGITCMGYAHAWSIHMCGIQGRWATYTQHRGYIHMGDMGRDTYMGMHIHNIFTWGDITHG